MESNQHFAEMLREYRKMMKWTQDEIAEKWGYSVDTISAWERGIRRPRNNEIPRLARLLDVKADQLRESVREVQPANEEAAENTREWKSSFEMWGEIQGIYKNRTEFNKQLSYPKLFENAQNVVAVGISLNALALNFDRQSMIESIVERGCHYELCFLEPNSTCIKEREAEEDYDEGSLSDLTRINIRHMLGIKKELIAKESELGEHLIIRTYNLAPRFNIYLVDNVMTVQCYAYKRGEDTPTFVIKKQGDKGLFDFYLDAVNYIRAKAQLAQTPQGK